MTQLNLQWDIEPLHASHTYFYTYYSGYEVQFIKAFADICPHLQFRRSIKLLILLGPCVWFNDIYKLIEADVAYGTKMSIFMIIVSAQI